MTSLPDPLVPPDVDLRDFPYMPVDIVRLFGSNFHASATDAEWRAGVTLWLKSYHQVPAASLPDDDIALCMLAELGRDQKTWKKLRTGALRGWVKCNDGRLYHRVVAEKALEAWIDKLSQRKVSAAGNAKRWGIEADVVDTETAIENACDLLKALNPNSRQLAKRLRKGLPPKSNGSPSGMPMGEPTGNPTGSKREYQAPPIGNPVVIPSGSQEKGREGNIRDSSESSAASDSAAAAKPRSPDLFARLNAEIGEKMHPNALWHAGEVQGWIEGGADFELDILPVIAAKVRQKPGYYRSLALFAEDVAKAVQRRKAGLPEVKIAVGQNIVPLRMRPSDGPDWDDESTSRRLFDRWKDGKGWIASWGPAPDKAGCRVPEIWLSEWLKEVTA